MWGACLTCLGSLGPNLARLARLSIAIPGKNKPLVADANSPPSGGNKRCQEPLLSPGGCRTGSCGSDGEQGLTSLGHCSANCITTPVDGPRRAKLGLKLLQTAHLRFLTPLLLFTSKTPPCGNAKQPDAPRQSERHWRLPILFCLPSLPPRPCRGHPLACSEEWPGQRRGMRLRRRTQRA